MLSGDANADSNGANSRQARARRASAVKVGEAIDTYAKEPRLSEEIERQTLNRSSGKPRIRLFRWNEEVAAHERMS